MPFTKDWMHDLRTFITEVQENLPATETGTRLHVGLDNLYEHLADMHDCEVDRVKTAQRKRKEGK